MSEASSPGTWPRSVLGVHSPTQRPLWCLRVSVTVTAPSPESQDESVSVALRAFISTV